MLGPSVLLVTVPDWMLLVTAGVWPAAWFTARILRRNRRLLSSPSLCAACGYDLRATPDHCPECERLRSSRRQPPHNPHYEGLLVKR